MRAVGRILLVLLVVVFVTLVGAGCYARRQLRGSLPQLDGTAMLAGLSETVTVARDGLGVPTITGATRRDAARALGYVHAQDRFFQMDLQRRQPAGELSGLVGERAFPVDAEARLHRFRRIARDAYARTDPDWRAVLDAYADGVNAGLRALAAPSLEYLMLRVAPEPWAPEDSLLTVLAMFNSLQGRQAAFEQTNAQLQAALPEPFFRFLTMAGSEWDTPLTGEISPRPAVPDAAVLNLRSRHDKAAKHVESARSSTGVGRWHDWRDATVDEAAIIGSNNWAVDAERSASGHAIVANDMHLNIGVPNIWYRAVMVMPDAADPLRTSRLAGVTLPGLPGIVVGSNGHVAWGFTNTGGDWSDLVRIEPDPGDPSRYLTPQGPVPFTTVDESIAIKDAPARAVTVRGTIWGPIVWKDAAGREYAQRWIAHDAELLATDLARPERARTVDELLVAFAGLGLPNQNVAMADANGRIAWTIGGAIPRRKGLDGFTPQSWADGTRGWDGYLEAGEFPRVVSPEDGRLWTANAPVVGGEQLARIGDGGYADGIRARIIRDRLSRLGRATPRDMLDVQLDDSALFLERWRTLLLETLARHDARGGPNAVARGEFKRLADTTWTGRASTESVAYRLVRTFRGQAVRSVMRFITAPALARDPSFDYTRTLRTEGPVWALVTERPEHLLDPQFASWDDLLLASVDAAIDELTADDQPLSGRTWGELNRAIIQHPLAAAVPQLHRWLDMPADPLPGDVFTPRAHSPRAGPSERMVVSPGHEEDGILHMPTGQSAHPLSPYFGDMHRAWVNGEPIPFLPGPPVHTLTLTPFGSEK